MPRARRRPSGPSRATGGATARGPVPLSHPFAGQLTGLLHPAGELRFVELALADVEVTDFLVFGLAGRDRMQRRAAEECHFDVLSEAMKAEEPDAVLDAVERRVPFDRLAHAGDGAHDERIEAAPDLAFPARHGRDIGLHGGIAIGLRDLRIAAGEEYGLRSNLARDRPRSGPLRGGLPCGLRRFLGRLAGHRVHSD